MNYDYIFLITIDSLRADHLSCYGYPRQTTSFLDSLAAKGWLFKNFFSNGPLTPRSFPAILCSQYAFQGKAHDLNSFYLPESATLISEILQKNNYQTACLQAGNPFIGGFYGYSRGFDYFKDYLDATAQQKIERKNTGWQFWLKSIVKKNKLLERLARRIHLVISSQKKLKRVQSADLPFVRAQKINQDAKSWIKKNKHRRFFIWLHYMDTHQPHFYHQPEAKQLLIKKNFSLKRIAQLWGLIDCHLLPKQKLLKDIIDLYDIEIRYLDNQLKSLFVWLQQKNLLKNSLVIITSDHGDEFGEHQGLGHMLKLYDEMIRVPLIFYGKHLKQKIFNQNYEMIDLAPTILEMAGLKAEDQFEGSSFFKKNLKQTYRKDFIISESLRTKNKKNIRLVTVRNNSWKLIYDTEDSTKNELFKINQDKKEERNLYNNFKNTAIVKDLESMISNHLNKQIKPQPELSEKTWLKQQAQKIQKTHRDII